MTALLALALVLPMDGTATESQAPTERFEPRVPDPLHRIPELAVPQAEHIESLTPMALRREIARAEGRISDLQKARDAELAGFAAAVAGAEARAMSNGPSAAAAGTDEDGVATPVPPTAEPLLDPNTNKTRRRAIQRHYGSRLEEARAHLARLLARQADIDPEASDQQRLREATAAGSAAR